MIRRIAVSNSLDLVVSFRKKHGSGKGQMCSHTEDKSHKLLGIMLVARTAKLRGRLKQCPVFE